MSDFELIVTGGATSSTSDVEYVDLASDIPPPTGSGTKYRLSSGMVLIDRICEGVPALVPDFFAIGANGEARDLYWLGFDEKTCVLRQGVPQPSVAGGWTGVPDLCIDTSGENVTVDGYLLLTGTPPNDEDGFLLIAIPAKNKPAIIDYCHIYCSVKIGEVSYRLRVQLGPDNTMNFGNIPTWSKGAATYEAGVPIYARVFANAEVNSILFHPDQWPACAAWNPSMGEETASPSYVFGLASVSTMAFTPTGQTMDWEFVGLMGRV